MKCPICGCDIEDRQVISHAAKLHAKKGGSKTSTAKAKASRINGLKGGRPAKAEDQKRVHCR